jgi:RND superfamily putative drug exporter
MGGTGKVVTNAGLVFAFTMMAMAVSDLRIIAQVGTTIGLGLLFDTLIVRSFMTPSIAALLGRWFWWPQIVRPRPASALLQPVGPRPLARALLLREQPVGGGYPVPDRTPYGLAEHGHHGRVQVSDRLGQARFEPRD